MTLPSLLVSHWNKKLVVFQFVKLWGIIQFIGWHNLELVGVTIQDSYINQLISSINQL